MEVGVALPDIDVDGGNAFPDTDAGVEMVFVGTDVGVINAFDDNDVGLGIVSEVIDVMVCGEFPGIAVPEGTGLIDAVVELK